MPQNVGSIEDLITEAFPGKPSSSAIYSEVKLSFTVRFTLVFPVHFLFYLSWRVIYILKS